MGFDHNDNEAADDAANDEETQEYGPHPGKIDNNDIIVGEGEKPKLFE